MTRHESLATSESPDGRQEGKIERVPGQPVTARGEATRRRILDAAEEVFGELGYYEASISEITRRANVAQGTYYLYFRNKLEIFVQLVEDLGHRLRAAIREANEGAASRMEMERQGFQAFFTFVAEHRRIYRIVQEAERVAPEVAQDYYHRISDGYERGLRQAMASGEIVRLQPEAIAYALMGIAHFAALRWLVWPEATLDGDQSPQIPQEIFDAIFAFIARGLTPDPSASSD
jgi:AcrR family transcriptional regulator